MKYCHRCGATLVPADPPRYSTATGEKINEVCPTNDCRHYGHPCEYPDTSWWRTKRCTYCGQPPWSW